MTKDEYGEQLEAITLEAEMKLIPLADKVRTEIVLPFCRKNNNGFAFYEERGKGNRVCWDSYTKDGKYDWSPEMKVVLAILDLETFTRGELGMWVLSVRASDL